jgi:hypothetical protein
VVARRRCRRWRRRCRRRGRRRPSSPSRSSFGDNKINVIKAIARSFPARPEGSSQPRRSRSHQGREGITKDEAEAIKAKLGEAGAEISIE